MIRSAVVILFNSTKTEFLVGKESVWVSDIKELIKDDKTFIRSTFSKSVTNEKAHDDPEEVAYYENQVPKFLENQRIMAMIDRLSDSHPPRITFGDVKYKRTDTGTYYSYTLPQYVPAGRQSNFPKGGMKQGVDADLKDGCEIHADTNTPAWSWTRYSSSDSRSAETT